MISKSVASTTAEYDRSIERVRLVRTLMGGTTAMRAAGIRYLPQEPAEDDKAYKNRLARSILFNATGKTVADMTGKVFTKPVVLEDDVPAALKELTEDIDLTGRHINVFARDVFYDAMQTGIAFILTDMPPAVKREDGRHATIADERAAGTRPYLVHLPLECLIGWKSAVVNGVETLTQVRISECVTEPDGDYHEKDIEQIRVIEPGKWQTWRKGKDETWVPHDEGTNSLDKIPLAVAYFNRTGYMSGSPPLEKLAELNVAHWQSASDQRNILHCARVPILFGAGWTDDDKLTVGASSMIRNSNPSATLAYVEHSGAAIGAGRDELTDLMFAMQTMGLQLLVPQPGGKTATGEIRDDAKENSPLSAMAQALQDALEISLGFMAEYMGLGEDAGGSVVINTDFGVRTGAADMQQLLDAVNSGQLSKRTFWLEWQRRGALSDSFDAEIEEDRISEEAPALDSSIPMQLT